MNAIDAIGGPQLWARRLSWATAAGIVLGVVGPFGSYFNDGAVPRIAYWTGMMWLGTLMLGLTVGPAVRWATQAGQPRLFVAGVATLLACLPLAAFGAFATESAWPVVIGKLAPLDWYAQTLFIAAPLVGLALWAERGAATAVADASPPAAPGSALAGDILCLQMEDHYVRVHRPTGSTLVLMPLHQAMADMAGRPGLQVHRSWWVARAAVRTAVTTGRTPCLLLSNGLSVPVARNRIAALRQAGWIAGTGMG